MCACHECGTGLPDGSKGECSSDLCVRMRLHKPSRNLNRAQAARDHNPKVRGPRREEPSSACTAQTPQRTCCLIAYIACHRCRANRCCGMVPTFLNLAILCLLPSLQGRQWRCLGRWPRTLTLPQALKLALRPG